MRHLPPSTLITDQGKRILFRIDGRVYDLSYDQLRGLLELPPAFPGLGISIDGERFYFEFADDVNIDLTARQLLRRFAKVTPART